MNIWMAGFFGFDYLLPPGQCAVMEYDKTIVVRADDFERMKDAGEFQ